MPIDCALSIRELAARLANLRVILVGGKGGVGKTTIASLLALELSRTRPVVLFTSDPASNLADLFDGDSPPNLTIEKVDGPLLYSRFLAANLPSLLEIGDRGTYLDRDELQRLFELSLPGIDELMSWTRIGELAEEHAGATLIVDLAPTGHALRMLGSSEHFRALVEALDAMQDKHRDIVQQLTRRNVRDDIDAYIEEFAATAERTRALLADSTRTAFIAVMLSEPWVVEQTVRLIAAVRADGLAVPFVVLNRAAADCSCARCDSRRARDADAGRAIAADVIDAHEVDAPQSSTPLDSVDALRAYLDPTQRDAVAHAAQPQHESNPIVQRLALPATAKFLFFAGKGGVGKTTSATSVALQLAHAQRERQFVIVSVDPAHTLRDVFGTEQPPNNLRVETIDTRERWRRFRASLGAEIERAMSAFTPNGMSLTHDSDAMQKLIDIAPPGADELFAVTPLADLAADESIACVIVDTAPTGHFLRLLDLPATAGEWVREFMRILLRYRELIAPGSLAEELIRASRALHALDAALHSERSAVIVVTRPERIVVAETSRLIDELQERGVSVAALIANYVTPPSDCPCDLAIRDAEQRVLASLPQPALQLMRRDAPLTTLGELASLIPLQQ
jgi:arsenite-transporting ATPase